MRRPLPWPSEPRKRKAAESDVFYDVPINRFLMALRFAGVWHYCRGVDEWRTDECIVGHGVPSWMTIREREDNGTLSFRCTVDGCAHPQIAACVPAFEERWLPPREQPRPAPLRAVRGLGACALHADAGEDLLKRIPARVYLPVIAGVEVSDSGRGLCPYHDDHNPSLRVMPDDETGHWCYACNRGGTVIDLGAYIYRIEPRGAGYGEIRAKLIDALLGMAVAA